MLLLFDYTAADVPIRHDGRLPRRRVRLFPPLLNDGPDVGEEALGYYYIILLYFLSHDGTIPMSRLQR